MDIVLQIRDSNKTGMAIFIPDIIVLNKTTPNQNFTIILKDGWQVDDILYMGGTYTIIDNGNKKYTAKLNPSNLPSTNEKWFVNFSIVES